MPLRQPRPSFASRQLARWLPLTARPHWSSWAFGLAMASLCLAFQLASPPSTSIILLLLLLTAYSVWYLGKAGLALTCASVVIGAWLDFRYVEVGPQLGIDVWNLGSRLASVGLLAFVLSGLRRCLAIERWRAATDQLTGIPNKRAFEEEMADVIVQSARAGETLVLIFLDLDGFKAVNDRYGHAAGNHVLTTFASEASKAVRAADLFARIGGDEFAALLAVPDAAEGDRVARLLHRRLSKVLSTTGFDVTCSTGALVMPATAMAEREALLEQADSLMYVAKQAGKNVLHVGHGETLSAFDAGANPVHGMIDRVERATVSRRRA